jgi:amino acid transporter
VPAADNTVIDNTEEIEMSKRKNTHSEPEVKRGGGRWLVVLLVVGVGGYLGVQALTGYLATYAANPAAPGDLSIGTWAVAIVVALFLAWCFTGGSKGDRR